MLRTIKKFISIAPGSFFLTLLFLLIMSIDGIVTPYFMGTFVDALTNQQFNQAFHLTLFWLGGLIAISVALLASSYFKGKYIYKVNLHLKERLISSFIAQAGKDTKSSTFLTRITTHMKELEDRYLNNLFTLVYCLSQALVTSISLFWIHWQAALVFIFLGGIPALVPSLAKKYLIQATQLWQKANEGLIERLENLMNGRQLFERYQAQEEINHQVIQSLQTNESKYFQMKLYQNVAGALVSLLYSLSLIGALILAIFSVKSGQLSAGSLLTLYLAGDRVLAPIVTAVNLINEMTSVQPVLDELEVHESASEPKALSYSRSYQSQDLIQIEQGQLGYNQTIILSDLNLSIGPEDKILIQGGSGQGKSTLLQGLLLELPLQEGTLTYQTDFNQESLYQDIVLIEQKPVVLNETLGFNLSLGKDFTEDELLRVLREVHLDQYANPESLGTLIGKNYLRLSGGEVKRLEIARALLYDKKLLICDEPLSGLDQVLAQEIHQVLMAYPGAVIEVEHHLPKDVDPSSYDQVWQVEEGSVQVSYPSSNG